MKDIEIAIKCLEEYNLAIAVVKNGELIYKSQEKGIKPMYILATKMKEIAKGASIADKVIGKGAAMLCRYIGVKEVYGKLISDSAMDQLKRGNIVYAYGEACPYIKNRDNTDICPIEKIATDIDNMEILIERIGKFFEGRV